MNISLDEILARLEKMDEASVDELMAERKKDTRRWLPNLGGQRLALHSKADELFFGGEPGGGKLLDLDTPIPTPAGWSTMRHMRVGSRLYDETGRETRVVAVSEVVFNEPAYRLRFDDGEEIVAGASHLWLTRARAGDEPLGSVRKTQAIADTLMVPGNGSFNHQIVKVNGKGAHTIVAAEPVPPRPMKCIEVENKSHLYLCGRNMVPTHNSSLLVGVAITEHTNSIIFRREYSQIKGLEDEAAAIIGTRKGYNATAHIWRIPGEPARTLEFGSVPHESDVDRFQGRPHSLKGFDEITHFSRSQYKYLTLWLRTTIKGERCRIIATGNPPTRPDGFWVVQYWGPWLDPRHSNPAAPGELRWAVPRDDDSEDELFFSSCEEAIEHVKTLANPPRDPETGEILPPRSRTFIPGKLSENPDLARSGYGAVLAYADKSLKGLAGGKFETSLPDDEWQVIPTSWIMAAQERWTPEPPKDVPMTAMGVDVAQGGIDETVVAPRHDWWYAPVVSVPGSKTPLPSDTAALVVKHRRDGAAVIVDCGGGYGGGVVDWLRNNQIVAISHKGSNAAMGRSKDRAHAFINRRAEVWWRFREALDPDQKGGSPIALPPDAMLRADLASMR